MNYSIQENEVVLIPETDMDIYKIGVMHNRYGGRIVATRDSDHPEATIKSYNINCNIILDFMLLRADNGEKK